MNRNSIGRLMQKAGSMLSGGSRGGATGRRGTARGTTATRTRGRRTGGGGIGSILRRVFR